MATIDEKVVELRFENKQFESESKRSMSTLDRLKDKLNFKGMSKGINELSNNLNKISFGGLATGISTIASRFNALEVAGFTAMQEITRSAMYAGKRMIKALTIDPITDGYNEYELVLNTVQTTMRATGKSMEYVEGQLKLLDEYADKTVYSTKDMVANLSKFTNAGIPLDKATTAMIGIANMTADAGQNARAASIAYYNLGQAISTGYLSKIDYNSINNQGLATMEWKKQMVAAAVEMGTIKKVGKDLYKAGKKSYNLQQLFTEGLQQQWATSKVMMKVFQDYGNEETKIGKRAYEAATAVRDFHAMMENVSATAGTGWKTTWDLIFGNLEEATKLWTGLTNVINKMINATTNLRNSILSGAMRFKPIENMIKKIQDSKITKNIDKMTDKINNTSKAIKNTSRTLSEYKKVVSKVWKGDYKNNPDRKRLLEAEGWNYRAVQSLVNLGKQHKITNEDIIRAEKKAGIKTSELKKENIKQINKETIAIGNLTDAQLKKAKLSDEEILLYKQIQKASKKAGMSFEDFIDKYSKATDGRTLLINSFKNIGATFGAVFKSIKRGWSEVIDSFTFFNLYRIIEGFEKLTSQVRKFASSAKNMERMTNIFSGLFSVLKLVATIIGIKYKIIWTIFKTILETCGVSVLDFASAVGLMITKLVNWIEENDIIVKGLKILTQYVVESVIKIYKWLDSFIDFTKVAKKVVVELEAIAKAIKGLWKDAKKSGNIGKFFIVGLWNGIKSGIKTVLNGLRDLATNSLDTITKIWREHSPSKATYEIGKNFMMGLYNGIKDMIGWVIELIKAFGDQLIDLVKGIDFGAIFVSGILGGVIYLTSKLLNIFNTLANGVQGITNFVNSLTGVTNAVKGVLDSAKLVEDAFTGVLNAVQYKIYVSSIKDIAISAALLAGALYVISAIDVNKLKIAGGVLAGVIAVMVGISVAIKRFGVAEAKDMYGMVGSIIAIAVAAKILTSAFKDLASTKEIGADKIAMLMLLMIAFEGIIKSANSIKGGAKEGTKSILAIAGLLLVMTHMLKVISEINDWQVIAQAILFIGAMTLFINSMLAVIILCQKGIKSKSSPATAGLLSVAGLLIAMTICLKLIGKMSPDEVTQGIVVLGLFTKFILEIIALSYLPIKSKNIATLGSTFAGIGASLLAMSISVAILGHMDPGVLAKGLVAVGALTRLVGFLLIIFNLCPPGEVKGIGMSMMGIGIAIGIMAISVALLGHLDPEKVKNGIKAVGALSIFVAILIRALNGVNTSDLKKNLMAITATIGILALVTALLSIIKPERLIPATIAMGTLMGMLAFVLFAIQKMPVKGVIPNLIALTFVMASLGVILGVLSKFDPEGQIKTAIALSVLLVSMMGALFVLSKISKINFLDIFGGLAGLITIMTSMYILVPLIGILNGFNNAIPIMDALSKMILKLVLVLGLVSLIGILYSATGGLAATGILGLAALFTSMLLLIPVISGLSKIDNAIPIMDALSNFFIKISVMLGVLGLLGPLILAGVVSLTALLAILPLFGLMTVGLGALISKFPELEKWVDKGIDLFIKLANGIGKVIGAFVTGIATSVLKLLPNIGSSLSLFMLNATPFILGLKLMDKDTAKKASSLVKTILGLTAANIIDSVSRFLTKGESFSRLGTELSDFMINALPFILGVKFIDTKAMTGVKSLAQAVLYLTSANVLQGLANWITGGSDSLLTFGEQLPALGEHVKGFADSLSGLKEDNLDITDLASKIILKLAQTGKEIPDNSVWGKLFGTNGLAAFATELPNVANGVKNFISNLNGVDLTNTSVAEGAAKIISILADTGKKVHDNSVWGKLFGDNGLPKFAKKLPDVADNLKKFISNLEGADTKVADSAALLIDKIAYLGKRDLKKFGENLPSFSKRLKDLGTGLKDFINEMNGVSKDDAKTAAAKTELIVEAITAIVEQVSKTLKGKVLTVKNQFGDFIINAAAGMSSKKVGNEIDKKANDLVDGYAKAIKSKGNKSKVYKAAYEMARKAVEAVAAAQDSNSPSKETFKLGGYFVSGFRNAIHQSGDKIYGEAYSMGDEAKSGLSTAISAISKSIDSDLDSTPTIRPVIDLSDVNAGVASMNNMLGDKSVNVKGNLSAISRGMSNRNQNGNDSVVSAIDKLRNTMSGSNGDTYNINGINYNGDNEVEQAIQTLVRASIVERRV